MRELKTQIEINATPEKIWQLLMDFDSYPEWNPFIISVIGKPKLRERLKVTLKQEGSKPMVFKPQVTLFKREKQFGWLGSLVTRGIFDGHHIFELETMDKDKVLFIQREEFSGLLLPILWKSLNTKGRAGFEAMNTQLKMLAEKKPD